MHSPAPCFGLNTIMQSANGRPIDDYRSFYQGLCHTDIDYYLKKDTQGLHSNRPVVCAACLVVLGNDPQHLTASQRTLLDGMLKVLALDQDDYCVAWYPLSGATPLSQAILKYAPCSVLFLGSAFKKHVIPSSSEIPFLYTYSPEELEADPRLKRSAFDTLLGLKKQLS